MRGGWTSGRRSLTRPSTVGTKQRIHLPKCCITITTANTRSGIKHRSALIHNRVASMTAEARRMKNQAIEATDSMHAARAEAREAQLRTQQRDSDCRALLARVQ